MVGSFGLIVAVIALVSFSRLLRTAEVARQRLGAILASTPDPVLVTDQENRLILANPAAKQALGMKLGSSEGLPADHVISQPELRLLLQEPDSDNRSAELVMPDGKVYFATASAIIAGGRPVGRVCVMRDVTHFKELDALKSDFVSSVSHDLRSPLTLIRGYATMLEMVGGLNEQQLGYVGKIVIGVESMSRMVTNLLDLGRIDAGVGLQVEKTVVMDIVKAVMEPLQLIADQKNIDLAQVAAPDLPETIDADRALLQQAFITWWRMPSSTRPSMARSPCGLKPLRRVSSSKCRIPASALRRRICRASLKSSSAAASVKRVPSAAPGWAWPLSARSPNCMAARSGWRVSLGRAVPFSCSFLLNPPDAPKIEPK